MTEDSMLGPTLLDRGPFVSVDIETTGCRPGTSSVIEIGAARIEDGVVTAHFTSLVRPNDSIPPAVVHLTGITEEMAAAAPSIDDVMLAFRDFASGAVLIAHNHRFDMSFLDYEAERGWGAPFARPVLDTLSLARRLHPELDRHNLRDLAAHYSITTVPNHRALPDALATAEVFLSMLPKLDSSELRTAADLARLCGVAQQSRLAGKLALATHLPDSAGVYVFRDETGAVIYVGRARSLRTRVRNHFYAADDLDCPSPASEVAAITCYPIASTLDAILLELHLHDRYSPPFNRNKHARKRPLYLHMDVDSAFPSLRPTHRRLRSGELIGPLANEWAAATIADAVSEHFGLRMCRRNLDDCASANCRARDRHLCHAPEAYTAGEQAYASGVRAAIAVFGGNGSAFRQVLQTMQEQSASAERFEDAAKYRDAARALDRTLAALAMAQRATAEPVTVILEGDESFATVIVLVRGWRFTTLRLTRSDVQSGEIRQRLARAVQHARKTATRGTPLTSGRLRDMGVIDSYRQQHAPIAFPVGANTDDAVAQLAAAIRKLMRVPRKRHAVASGA
ncbi:MAG: hypothetical protein EG823_00015 [Actinobacteria bacterium]|nr:hypothetical protein [Actinomycetota bacterium]